MRMDGTKPRASDKNALSSRRTAPLKPKDGLNGAPPKRCIPLSFLAPELPIHDLHRLGRVFAARFLSQREVENRAHALTSCPDAAVAHPMNRDEVLGVAFGGFHEEVE